jgi:hypothetical protein
VEESTSYYDFIHRIVDTVLEDESSVDLVFNAALHAWKIKERKLTDAMIWMTKNSKELKPVVY